MERPNIGLNESNNPLWQLGVLGSLGKSPVADSNAILQSDQGLDRRSGSVRLHYTVENSQPLL